MRSLKILVAFAALGTVLYAMDRATRPPAGSQAGPASAEGFGIARLIEAHAGLSVSGIVTTPGDAGLSDFRGLLAVDGRLRPVYGRVRGDCGGGAGSECWELAYLEIDGRPATGRVAALPAAEAAPAGTDGDEEIETADISTPSMDHSDAHPPIGTAEVVLPGDAALDIAAAASDGNAAMPFPEPRPDLATLDAARPDEPAPDDADGRPHAPTHAVDRDVINVRSGPGTGSEIVGRLTAGLRLAKIGEQDGWGRFVVLDGTARGREVWVALSILKPVP